METSSYRTRVLNSSGKPIGIHQVNELGEGAFKLIFTIINGITYLVSPAKWEERNEGA